MENFRILEGSNDEIIKAEKFEAINVVISEFNSKEIALLEAEKRCLAIIDEQNAELEKLAIAKKDLELERAIIEKYKAEKQETEVVEKQEEQ